MNQSKHFNNMIKKMAKMVEPPTIKLLCHFDQSLEDSSTYNRTPIIWGTSNKLYYYSGSNLSKFGYSASVIGNKLDNNGNSVDRHDNFIAYDISDVDLSGPFCIDYWWREVGSYGGVPMGLLPYATDLYLVNTATYVLRHEAVSVNTYDPATDTTLSVSVPRTSTIRHMAVTRDKYNVLRWFCNGSLVASYTNSFNFTSSYIRMALTYSDSTNARFNVDELRIVVGTPCYTENFTPRETPYTLEDIE